MKGEKQLSSLAYQWGPPLVHPFGLYLPPDEKTLKRDPISRLSPMFHRRCDPMIGSTRRPLPDTLPEGGLTSGSLSITHQDLPPAGCVGGPLVSCMRFVLV